jgi:hypothetical protein
MHETSPLFTLIVFKYKKTVRIAINIIHYNFSNHDFAEGTNMKRLWLVLFLCSCVPQPIVIQSAPPTQQSNITSQQEEQLRQQQEIIKQQQKMLSELSKKEIPPNPPKEGDFFLSYNEPTRQKTLYYSSCMLIMQELTKEDSLDSKGNDFAKKAYSGASALLFATVYDKRLSSKELNRRLEYLLKQSLRLIRNSTPATRGKLVDKCIAGSDSFLKADAVLNKKNNSF